MSNGTASARLDKIMNRLEAIRASVEACPDELAHECRFRFLLDLADVQEALAAERMNLLREELAQTLPKLTGGSPDDFEEIDPAFEADPAGWPGVWMPELDGFCGDFDGPTPMDVLCRDFSDAELERSAEDWDAMFRAAYPDLVTDGDLIAAGLAVG